MDNQEYSNDEDGDDYEPAFLNSRAQSFFLPPKQLTFKDEEVIEMHISDCEDDGFVNQFKVSTKKSKSKQKKKNNKRIRNIEDYFQYDSLKEKQIDAFYEFVRSAKRYWSNGDYDDDSVQKHVLNKVSIMRFCIARDFKLKKVMTLWQNWVQWRLEYQPHLIRKYEIEGSSLNKCFYLCKRNKNGNPCIIISPGATTEVYPTEVLWRLVTYIMEKACRKADRNGTTQICVLFDRSGMTNSTDKKWVPAYKELSTIIQDYYPERLHKAYVLGMNWVAKFVYALVKPFIAKKTRNKVVILKNVDHLKEFFDEGNLQVKHGGTYELPE